jgi:hypothetical protein
VAFYPRISSAFAHSGTGEALWSLTRLDRNGSVFVLDHVFCNFAGFCNAAALNLNVSNCMGFVFCLQNYAQRKALEYSSQTAFFMAIVLTQWANVINNKTRRVSVFRHGMK